MTARRFETDQVLARVEGSARAVLQAERVALNLVQRMCGVATVTARYIEAVAGTEARVVDTRKTTPGLRALWNVTPCAAAVATTTATRCRTP